MVDPNEVQSERSKRKLGEKEFSREQAEGIVDVLDDHIDARVPDDIVTEEDLDKASKSLGDELRHVESRFERRFGRFEDRHDATLRENNESLRAGLRETEGRLNSQINISISEIKEEHSASEGRVNSHIDSFSSIIREEHQASEGRLNSHIDNSLATVRKEHQASESRVNSHIDSSIAAIRREYQASEGRLNQQLTDSRQRYNTQLEQLERNLTERFAQNLTNTKQSVILWFIVSLAGILTSFELIARFFPPS